MAISDTTITAAITVIIPTSEIQVQKTRTVADGETVLSCTNSYEVYNILQRDQFIIEVEGGEQYAIATGWTDAAYHEALDAQVSND